MKWRFIVVARKTSRLVDQLQAVKWKRSPLTDADGQCEFLYQPDGWGKACRFLALRYEKPAESQDTEQPEQYQLFDTPEYTYRVFVTDMGGPLDTLVWFYNQRAGAENLIKEANNDAGLAAHPSNRWIMNANWFQIAMLAYNLNCWLQLFSREENVTVETIKHTTLATARLRFLFLAARIWRHAGKMGVSYSDHYQEKGGWICSRPLRAATCLMPHQESRIAFYAHAGQSSQTLVALILENGNKRKFRGSSSRHNTAAQ